MKGEDYMFIPETVDAHHDVTIMYRPHKVVQNMEEEISFTNWDLIALSCQRHEWRRIARAGPSTWLLALRVWFPIMKICRRATI